jgi:nondiscriminating aspartyl-tRNA synthetase
VEMQVQAIDVLSQKNASIPVEIAREKKMRSLGLPALLQYRPLTLRNEKVRAIFKIEAEICRAFRDFLNLSGFTEIHTPKIVATGTEGGANLFSVNYFGRKAFLAQSPQFYKQIMVGVFERVFEIGPVYRAEEHNTIRHLNEYVSMDLEMGFITSEQDLLHLETDMLRHVFAHLNEHCRHELAMHDAVCPEIKTIPALTLSEAHEVLARVRSESSGATSQASPLREAGDDLDPDDERLLCDHMSKTQGSDLVFVTHYPWKVRPFYALPAADGTSHSFDLLFRGLEITTGGLRIHEYSQLQQALEERGMDPASFEDYLQAFRWGMPPHGGLAIGLERVARQLLGLANVREAALFPRDGTRLIP